MMARISLLVAAGWALGLGPWCHAGGPPPEVAVTPAEVTVTCEGQRLAVSLADAVLRFGGVGAEVTLTPNLQLGEGWTQPERAAGAPRITRGREGLRVAITYPVAEARRFTVIASAYPGLGAIFVTSRLEVLDSARGQYYYWQSSLSGDRYFAPGRNGAAEVAFRTGDWHSMAWQPWWFVPHGQGGIAVLPTNAGGRAPGAAGGIFLHALPRSNLVCVGDSLDASFGLGEVADAAAAARLTAAARGRHLAALEPWRLPWPQGHWDYGRPAPRWLREAEVYNLYYRNAAQWTEDNVAGKLKGFPFIIGSTPDLAALERCHRHGIKLLHYVVFTCLLDTAMQVREGGQVYSEWSESLDHETRDLKDHPEWVCIDHDGKAQHDGWGMAHGHPGLLNTCLHQPGLREAAVRQVKMLMAAGYDGVFVDLSGPTVECHGPKFGKHTHLHPDWTNTQAYEDVLRAVYAAVKSYGDDRVVIQNTCTGLLPSHWADCDGQMLEAFPYGAENAQLRATGPELQWQRRRHAEAVRHGKVPVILPYFGAGDPARVKRAAALSRAYAALAGFLWADGLGLADVKGTEGFARELYQARLGRPVGEPAEAEMALAQGFERGAAALNLGPGAARLSIPWAEVSSARDLVSERVRPARRGAVSGSLAGESGRVLVPAQ
jgi:hypothetical protein